MIFNNEAAWSSKIIDCGQPDLEIMIIETLMNNKERWIYVMGYKPPDMKLCVFIDDFSLMCDLILKGCNHIML